VIATTPPGRLSVVATPIGNLEDVTLRALRTLREADVILAEDTRRTRVLCAHHGIATPLRAYHAHSAEREMRRCLDELAAGRHVALVTDAGTPLVSDPGAELVRAAAEMGAAVEAVPGPSALTAALSVSAIPFDAFRFVGFAPRAGSRRRDWLQRIADSEEAVVFFESPARVARTLADLARVLDPARRVAACRELTKAYEEIARGTASELAARFATGARGEFTCVVEARREADPRVAEGVTESADATIARLTGERLPPPEIARRVAAATGLSRSEAYRRVRAARSTPR
jgi:16S rRNA (cytidine1402-2'-O)-methyltransferase